MSRKEPTARSWADSKPADAEAPRWASRTPPADWCSLSTRLSAGGGGEAMGEASSQTAAGAAFKEAYAEGLQRAKSTVEAIMDRYHTAIARLEVLREEILRSSEEDFILLAMHIATETLADDATGRLDFTARMVEHALGLLQEADTITLHVGSTDYRAIKERFSVLLEEGSHVRVVDDPSINLGGVIAHCELGRVDATLQSRLASIGEELRRKSAANHTEAPDPTPDPLDVRS